MRKLAKGTEYNIIFDNAGGVTLQLNETWAHYYEPSRIKDAAADILEFLQNDGTSDWDGHEQEALDLDPTGEEINGGGYRVFSDLKDVLKCDWRNALEFATAVGLELHQR